MTGALGGLIPHISGRVALERHHEELSRLSEEQNNNRRPGLVTGGKARREKVDTYANQEPDRRSSSQGVYGVANGFDGGEDAPEERQ